MSTDNSSYTTISAVGFFTFWMFWTLNSSSGKDMNDVVVEYWAAKTEVLQSE